MSEQPPAGYGYGGQPPSPPGGARPGELLDRFVARVTADRDAAVAKLPTVVKAQNEADARDLLDDVEQDVRARDQLAGFRELADVVADPAATRHEDHPRGAVRREHLRVVTGS